MKRLHRIACASGLLAALGTSAGVARAETSATPLPGDTRLVQFEYDQDNTFLVLARPKSLTHIEFADDERIQTVAAGDTKDWELTPTQNRRHLFIKPIYEQLETSMTVITDKRTYQFVLRSTGAGAKWYQRVTWRYGRSTMLELRAQEERGEPQAATGKAAARQTADPDLATGVSPQDLRFGYSLEGQAPFRPVSLFDDGRFTWIRMPAKLAQLPALFGLSEGGELSIVNYVVQGDYLVAQRVMDQGILKLGRQEVRFTRKKSGGIFGWFTGWGNR